MLRVLKRMMSDKLRAAVSPVRRDVAKIKAGIAKLTETKAVKNVAG